MVFTSILVWVFLIGTSLFVVYPLIYVAAAAFSPQQNIASLREWRDLEKFYLPLSEHGFSSLVPQYIDRSGGNNDQYGIYLCFECLCIFKIPLCI